MFGVGQRFRTRAQIPVVCWWYYDTVGILEDYSDCAQATIESGICFTIVEIPENEPERIGCKVENEVELKHRVLPVFCRRRHWWSLPLLTRAVSFQVEIAAQVIQDQCDPLPDSP